MINDRRKKNSHIFVSMLMFSELRWRCNKSTNQILYTIKFENEKENSQKKVDLKKKRFSRCSLISWFKKIHLPQILRKYLQRTHVSNISVPQKQRLDWLFYNWFVETFLFSEFANCLLFFYVVKTTHSRTPIERTGNKNQSGFNINVIILL